MRKLLSIALLFAASAFGQFTNATKLRGHPLCNPLTMTDGWALTWSASGGCYQNAATVAGSAAWGSITGTLSSQTDLNTALGLKAALASPTFTGHITVEGVTATGATGTGKFLFDGSPTIASPTISGHMVVEGVTPTGATGTGKFVFDGTPTINNAILFAPALGTPASGVGTNLTGLPLAAITGFGSNVAAFLATPTGANFNTMLVNGVPIAQNSQSAAYTTVLSDGGKQIYHPSADTTARTITIDSNANVAYQIGTTLTFVNDTSAGVMTIAITSDTLILAGTGSTGSRTLAAGGIATAVKMTSTRWIINGTGLT